MSLHNGVEVLGKITGSGCIAGSVVATYAAVAASKAQQDLEEGKIVKGDMILAAIAGYVFHSAVSYFPLRCALLQER